MGSRAAGDRPAVLGGIREGKAMGDGYVITLPESGNHILDIRPVNRLTKEERKDDAFLILGVAKGYREAREVVRCMVDDMYRTTGGFNWKTYMEYLENRDKGAVDEEET